jgi:hypothetical protein
MKRRAAGVVFPKQSKCLRLGEVIRWDLPGNGHFFSGFYAARAEVLRFREWLL